METIIFEKTGEVRRNLKELEEKLKVSIKIVGKKVIITGEAMDEYEAMIILDAINFGFSEKKALQLKDPDFQFRKISIKDFTRRKNLEDVRGRLIGSEGKTKRTIENITDSELEIRNNSVGIICLADSMDDTVTAIKNLVRGSKQSNVYAYLEKMNANRKRTLAADLGLKSKAEEDIKQDRKSKKDKKKAFKDESEEDFDSDEDYEDSEEDY